MKSARWALIAVVALIGSQLAATAAADAIGTPWPTGTVFVATAQLRTGFGGGVYAVLPGGGGTQHLGSGSVNDVAVAPDGTVYWGDCNGNVYSYFPGSGASYLRTVGGCVAAIAVEPDNSLLVDSSGGLQNCPATAAGSCTTLSYELQASGMVVDPEGDVYAMSGGGQPELVLAGADDIVRLSGLFGGSATAESLRFGPGGDLLTAVPFGHEVVDQSLNSLSATTTYSVGSDYVAGTVEDTAGNVFASDAKDDPSTQDQIDEFPVGTTTNPAVYQTGFDTPRGLSSYPVVDAPTRTDSSVALGSDTDTGSPITVNDSVTLTATVDGGSATNGLVQFASNGSPLGDAVSVSGGTAQTTTTLPAGSDAITATYLGSGTERPSQSTALDYTVNKLGTTTRLHSSASRTPPQDQPVHVVASVLPTGGGATATGDVDFYIGTNYVGYATVDSRGRAATDLTLPAHAVRVHAVYSGDSDYDGSTSNALSFTPTAPYTPGLTTSLNMGPYQPNGHQNVGIAVKVKGVTGQPVPTGTITTDDNRFTCTALTPPSSGVTATARCFARSVPPDPYSVTITYSGDSIYASANDEQSFYVGG